MKVICPYCRDEFENPHRKESEAESFSYYWSGGHENCKYEWDVKKWCKNCREPICICNIKPNETAKE